MKDYRERRVMEIVEYIISTLIHRKTICIKIQSAKAFPGGCRGLQLNFAATK